MNHPMPSARDLREHLKEVLIVDDDPAFARLVARLCELAGYATYIVGDGEAALDAVDAARPSLVLTDLLLPGIDGTEVVRRLKAETRTADLPVIAMSAVYRGTRHERELQKLGASAFLEKPFDREALQAAIAGTIGAAPGAEGRPPGNLLATIASQPVSEVLVDARDRSFSGSIAFRNGRTEKMILFARGRPVSIRSNLARERLGRYLHAAGRIDAGELETLVSRERASGESQGELLVESGVMVRAEVTEWIQRHAETTFDELCGWSLGNVWERAGVRQIVGSSPLAFSADHAIERASRRIARGPLERLLAPHLASRVDLVTAREGVTPPRAVADLVAAHTPGCTVDQLMSRHACAIYAAWRTGAVEFRRVDGEAPTPPIGITSQTEKFLAKRLSLQERRNLFEVLDLDPGSSDQEVSAAFIRLANEYHPDRFSDQSEHTQLLADEIFARASKAHEVLSDPRGREAYEAKVEAFDLGRLAEDVTLTRLACADADVARAETAMAARQYGKAVRFYERASRSDPGNVDHRVAWGWARFLAAGGDEAARAGAFEAVRSAALASPESAAGFYYLGMIYKSRDDAPRARKSFETALRIDPEYVKAEREVALLRRRAP